MSEHSELDELKLLWQKQEDEHSYTEDEIFKMLHKKSTSIMRWLLIITILEFVITIIFSIFNMMGSWHMFGDEIINLVGVERINTFESLSNVSILISIVFMILAYYYYRKISTNSSVKELMSSIKRFRRIVWIFIIFVFCFSIYLAAPIYFEVGRQLFIENIGTTVFSPAEIEEKATMVGYVMIAILAMMILIASLVYYGVIYGFFIYRLSRNLKELKKIDTGR